MTENTSQRHHARFDKPEIVNIDDDDDDDADYDVNARDNIDLPQKGRARSSQVSRPPSSHISRVDEEPTGSDGRRSGVPLVETVDRGVGPTPRPPPPPPGAALEPTLSSYLSFQPFPTTRNGLLEAYGLPYVYSHLPHGVNTPIPINPSNLEGRYHWPPTSPFHQHFHGLHPSPLPPEISLLNMRGPMLPVDTSVAQLATRIQLDQLRRSYYSPLSSRSFSPSSLSGLPLGTGPFLMDYPPPPSISGRSMFSDVRPTPGSGSITLPGSLESSRLTSPRASIVGGKSRKRALSHSPLSDFLDIQSLTRSSEGSLQLASFLQHSSRSSSAASGSYGHLSVASVGTASPGHTGTPSHPYLRAGCLAPSTLFYPLMGGHPRQVGHMMVPPSIQVTKAVPKCDPQVQISTTTKEAGSSSVVSSTRGGTRDGHKVKIKRDTGNLNTGSVEADEEDDNFEERRCSMPQEEVDIMETNCHWADCNRDFESQEHLVMHINQDHIQSNKKSFVCRWQDCSREEKPFKAQYMLVVHMRRHTGEKPHRCTFEGCMKAYSRLENLKTHLRSHTGEKPYMCEFPGCTKAFSNASDRAKHQNRTHSNAKPYVCKAVGCSKRYTDPSSLRKHVKTVHGADFYANKKHKGDTSCHVKKEGSNGDHEFCETSRRGEGHIQSSRSLFQVAGNGRQSQDNIGSAPSSHSHPSPESSPEVNVICDCEPGQSYLTDGQIVSDRGFILTNGVEDQDVVAESSDAEISGSGVLLSRRNRLNVGHVMQNRLKCQINSKVGSLSSLPHTTNGTSSHVGDRLIQLSVTKLLQGSPVKGSTEKESISYSATGKPQGHYGDAGRTLLPSSRRESSSSTLSSYMSSMRSMGSTFSSRRSSGTSPFSSRRSSGASARLSIANSPYEYDINGNLPNCVSRRSSEESSTNVSRMMQKTHLGSPQCLLNPAVVNGGETVCNGVDTKAGNKCYNERLARYFSSWPTADSVSTKHNLNEIFTSTPCQTPLPHGFPDPEIRRASDPVRFPNSPSASQKNLHRFHSLSAMQPLPIPASMQSLRDRTARSTDIVHDNTEDLVNHFSSVNNHINMYDNLVRGDSNGNVSKDELDSKIIQDGEDSITLDDMRVFLNECLNGGMSLQEYVGEVNLNHLPVQQELDLNIDACDLEPVDSVSLLLSPCLENGDVGDYNMDNGNSVEGNMFLYTDLPDFCQRLINTRSSAEDFRQLSPTFESVALVDEVKIEPELLLSDCQGSRYDACPAQVAGLAVCDGSLQQMNGSLQNHVQLYLNGGNDILPEQGGLVSSSTARKSGECQSMGYRSNDVSKCRVGQNMSGHDSMSGYGTSDDLVTLTFQGSQKPKSNNQTSVVSPEVRSGPHHSSVFNHQLQQEQSQTVSALSTLPSFLHPHLDHHNDSIHHKVLPSPSNGCNFIPTPPVGSKPSILRQKRFSPQLQVPHVSQSQIPANAKATSQAQLLLKQQQDHQYHGQRNLSSHVDPSLSSHVDPSLSSHGSQLQKTLCATKYANQNPPSLDLHHLYHANLQNCTPSEPSHRNIPRAETHTNHLSNGDLYNDTRHIPNKDSRYIPTKNTRHIPTSNHAPPSRNHLKSQNITSPTVHPTNHLRNGHQNTNTREIYPSRQPLYRTASTGQNTMASANLTNHFLSDGQYSMANNITSGQSSTKSPNTPLAAADPQNINNLHASLFQNIPHHTSALANHSADTEHLHSNFTHLCNPNEGSPGCHHVTSSTDCKENMATLIDDFMDTFSSISLENMIESIPFSPGPMSVRSTSRNSGHYSALMSTSNMVVNDMCSVLTQLAEENKYLSMRP